MTANYNGRQPNNTAYIKNFVYGSPANIWKQMQYVKEDGSTVSVLTTALSNVVDIYIKGDLFIDGSIINPSDVNIKDNIKTIDQETTD